MDYKIIITQSPDSGLWSAHKEYVNGIIGIPFMFAPSLDALKFKLEEDGEDGTNVYYSRYS